MSSKKKSRNSLTNKKKKNEVLPINALVWGKMKGFPPWPGRKEIPPKNHSIKPDKSWIYFFGASNFAYVDNCNVQPYEQFKEVNTKKMTKNLAVAIQCIDEFIMSGCNMPLPEFNSDQPGQSTNIIFDQLLFKSSLSEQSTPSSPKVKNTPSTVDKSSIEKSELETPRLQQSASIVKKRKLFDKLDNTSALNSEPKEENMDNTNVLELIEDELESSDECDSDNSAKLDNLNDIRQNDKPVIGVIGVTSEQLEIFKILKRGGFYVIFFNRKYLLDHLQIPSEMLKEKRINEFLNTCDVFFLGGWDENVLYNFFGEAAWKSLKITGKTIVDISWMKEQTSYDFASLANKLDAHYAQCYFVGNVEKWNSGLGQAFVTVFAGFRQGEIANSFRQTVLEHLGRILNCICDKIVECSTSLNFVSEMGTVVKSLDVYTAANIGEIMGLADKAGVSESMKILLPEMWNAPTQVDDIAYEFKDRVLITPDSLKDMAKEVQRRQDLNKFIDSVKRNDPLKKQSMHMDIETSYINYKVLFQSEDIKKFPHLKFEDLRL